MRALMRNSLSGQYTAYWAREIEVIMRVKVTLCLNTCVSRRMRESWQLRLNLDFGSSSSARVYYCSLS